MVLASELDDQATEARVLWVLLLIEVWGGGDMQKALAYGLRSLELTRLEGLKEQMGYTLTNLTNVYQNLDRFAEAGETNLEARSIWQELDNKPMLADALTMAQWLRSFEGDFRAALAAGDEAFRVSESVGNLWNQASALLTNARLYSELGEFGQTMQAIEEGRKYAEEAELNTFSFGVVREWVELYLKLGAIEEANRHADELAEGLQITVAMFRPLYAAVMVYLKIATGMLAQAEEVLVDVFQDLDVSESPILDVIYLVPAKARLELALGRPENARQALEQFIQRYRPTIVRIEMTETLYLYGRVLQALDETMKAREVLLEAHTLAAKMEMRWDHWQILAALAEIDERLGDQDKADSWRAQAQEIVNNIADHIGHEDLRLSFLAKPEIRFIMTR
jgi:tetratricopeptide (TPR) repeat protein